MSRSLNRWVLLIALLVSVMGAASPVLGSATAPKACCCDVGSCHCPDASMSWIPTCCASDDAAPEPVAAATPSTQVPSDAGQRPAADSFVVPPTETGDLADTDHACGSGPPGVALFTLHASFLI